MSRLFTQVWKDWGVDEESKHKQQAATWMMVPLGGVNLVLLRDEKGLTWHHDKAHLEVLEVKNQGDKALPSSWMSLLWSPAKQKDQATGLLADALAIAGQQSARLLAVRGIKRGEATIDAKVGQTIKETLAIGVHPRLNLKLSFHFPKLKGGAGAGKDKTLSQTRNSSHVAQWIDDLNRIFTTQANILFSKHTVKEPVVDSYIGGSGPYKTVADWTAEVGKHRDVTAAANVFLVGSWKGVSEDRYQDVNGSYLHGVHDIVCDDRASYDLFMTTLAHEMGHFLGHRRNIKFGHPDADKKHWLMTTVDWTRGVKVPRDYVQIFNPL